MHIHQQLFAVGGKPLQTHVAAKFFSWLPSGNVVLKLIAMNLTILKTSLTGTHMCTSVSKKSHGHHHSFFG